MQNWYKVAEKQSIDKNGCKVVYFKRQEVVIFKYQECYFALGNNCPHRKAPLSAGEIIDGVLTCPWHGARFDLATGKGLPGPHQAEIQSYHVKEQNGAVFLAVKEKGQ